jgi:hypothetical protein
VEILHVLSACKALSRALVTMLMEWGLELYPDLGFKYSRSSLTGQAGKGWKLISGRVPGRK